MTPRRAIELVPGRFAVCRLAPDAEVPPWAVSQDATLLSVTRTSTELSIVCDEALVPSMFERAEHGWRPLRIRGPIPFTEIGVVAGVTAPLAAAGVSVFVVSTFDTDYVLVPESRLEAAGAALRSAGFELH